MAGEEQVMIKVTLSNFIYKFRLTEHRIPHRKALNRYLQSYETRLYTTIAFFAIQRLYGAIRYFRDFPRLLQGR